MNSPAAVISDIQTLKNQLAHGEIDFFSSDDRRKIEVRKRRGRNTASFVPWKGADVIISQHPLQEYRGGSTVVVTEHAAALAKLFENLRDLGSGTLNYLNKYQFYGEIAEIVNVLLDSEKEPTELEVLLAALESAESTLTEWSKSLE